MEILKRSQRYYQFVLACLPVSIVFLLLMSLVRYIFYFTTRYRFEFVDWGSTLNSFFMGLRFDLLILGFFGLPVVTFFAGLSLSSLPEKLLFKSLKTYLMVVWIFITTSSFISLPFYMMKERHFRWAEDESIFIWPLVDKMTVILLALIFLFILLVGLKTVSKMKTKTKVSLWEKLPRGPQIAIYIAIPLLLVGLAARGTITAHHLEKAHSEISPWPHVNELVLNSVWCIDK